MLIVPGELNAFSIWRHERSHGGCIVVIRGGKRGCGTFLGSNAKTRFGFHIQAVLQTLMKTASCYWSFSNLLNSTLRSFVSVVSMSVWEV